MQVRSYVESESGRVYVTFSWKGRRVYLSTGLTSRRKFTGTEVPGSAAKSRRMRDIYNAVEDYCALHPDRTAARLKEELKAVIAGGVVCERKLADYMREYQSLSLTAGTAETYQRSIAKVCAFDRDCTFESVDRRWLASFVGWCRRDGLADNTISIYLRCIRAVFNYGIDEGYTSSYPFRRFKIPHQKTRHRALSLEQLRAIRDYRGEPFLYVYRDVFMLMFYLGGINIKDLLVNARIENGRLVYRRSKTGRLYDIKVEPEAMEILERYRGEGRLLDVADGCKGYREFNAMMNQNLKKIGVVEVVKDKAGKRRKLKRTPVEPGLSTYWARHTWATVAASIDVPKDVIAEMLGHGGNTVTDIYIEFDRRKVDEANRRVIDFVNSL